VQGGGGMMQRWGANGNDSDGYVVAKARGK
jgi:hypothetical protein